MLDPYYRVYLKQGPGATRSATFQVPDKLGVFKFAIKYQRQGLTWIRSENLVALRQFRHDEYERFLMIATPYYVSVLTLLGCLLIFTVYFLYSDFHGIKKS